MSNRPTTTGACCPKSDDSVTHLRLSDDGHAVGIMGLNTVFEQLWALGREPGEATDAELVGMARAQKNYITSRADVEAKYAAALRRDAKRAAFCARKNK